MKIRLVVLSLLSALFYQCSFEEPLFVLGQGDDVVVELKLEDKDGLLAIAFRGNGEEGFVGREVMDTYDTYAFAFDCPGEGEYLIQAITAEDTVFLGGYVESGYTPKIVWTGEEFWVKSFGIGYD
jgi:hypothetical protein